MQPLRLRATGADLSLRLQRLGGLGDIAVTKDQQDLRGSKRCQENKRKHRNHQGEPNEDVDIAPYHQSKDDQKGRDMDPKHEEVSRDRECVSFPDPRSLRGQRNSSRPNERLPQASDLHEIGVLPYAVEARIPC
jgi:hypothetical protein